MQHITDDMVDRLVGAEAAQHELETAFRSFALGRGAMQARVRTEAGGVKLSTLGAVLPDQDAVGAKVYTTIQGRFSFVILLFSAETGLPLASFDAGAITRIRTAACSVIVARKLARPGTETLALFGVGAQGRAHARQFVDTLGIRRILLADLHLRPDTGEALAAECGVPVEVVPPESAAAGGDVVVTATRSRTPVFPGEALRPGAVVAAVGSSLPQARELDDVTMARARAVVVEWREQAAREAGDLVLAAPESGVPGKLVELGNLLAGRAPGRTAADEIFVYKSVGVGLEDIVIAGLAWRLLNAA